MLLRQDINWIRIEQLMRKSIRGTPLSDEELQQVKAAHAQHPQHYKKLHDMVRREEQDAIRNWR